VISYGTFLSEPSCRSVVNVLFYPGFVGYKSLKVGLKLAKKIVFLSNIYIFKLWMVLNDKPARLSQTCQCMIQFRINHPLLVKVLRHFCNENVRNIIFFRRRVQLAAVGSVESHPVAQGE
jgi:hypothetical protein